MPSPFSEPDPRKDPKVTLYNLLLANEEQSRNLTQIEDLLHSIHRQLKPISTLATIILALMLLQLLTFFFIILGLISLPGLVRLLN